LPENKRSLPGNRAKRLLKSKYIGSPLLPLFRQGSLAPSEKLSPESQSVEHLQVTK
jgi:hypothetical protein